MKANTDPENQFLMGHAESPDWATAAAQCLLQMGQIKPDTNLGFLYLTDAYANQIETILAHFRKHTGIAHWVGTVGTGICASGKEYYETSAMAVMAGTFPENGFRMLPMLGKPGSDGALPGLREWLDPDHAYFGVVHGDPKNENLPQVIRQLGESLPNGFLVGGLSSSQGDCPQIADQITTGGLSGVVFSDEVPVITGLTQGCSPISGKHQITACERNILVELDGRPALDVFYEDIGEVLAREPERIANYIFAGLPITGSDTGDYLVRNLIGIDEENKLLAVGDLLEQSQTIQFCRRDGSTAWKDLDRMLADLKQRLDRAPKGGVYYSCLGRGRQLFGENSEELHAIQKSLGDFPLVGFFANGEISYNRLYGYTGVLTLFL